VGKRRASGETISISIAENLEGRGEKITRLEMGRELRIYDVGCSIIASGWLEKWRI
jgi:hypothetical protein